MKTDTEILDFLLSGDMCFDTFGTVDIHDIVTRLEPRFNDESFDIADEAYDALLLRARRVAIAIAMDLDAARELVIQQALAAAVGA